MQNSFITSLSLINIYYYYLTQYDVPTKYYNIKIFINQCDFFLQHGCHFQVCPSAHDYFYFNTYSVKLWFIQQLCWLDLSFNSQLSSYTGCWPWLVKFVLLFSYLCRIWRLIFLFPPILKINRTLFLVTQENT